MDGGGACGNGTVASATLTATVFVRPRFFAGQLLTEDDLTALTDYMTAKDRLHNRHLFGAGVVCGLWVSCDPWGGSRSPSSLATRWTAAATTSS